MDELAETSDFGWQVLRYLPIVAIAKIVRCPAYKIALWSNYSGTGSKVCFVRGGFIKIESQCLFRVMSGHFIGSPKTSAPNQ